MQTRLEAIQSIDAPLKHLDTHFASLRSTTETIDSTISFVSLSGKPEGVEDAADDDNPADAGASLQSADAPPEGSDAPDPAPPSGNGGDGGRPDGGAASDDVG